MPAIMPSTTDESWRKPGQPRDSVARERVRRAPRPWIPSAARTRVSRRLRARAPTRGLGRRCPRWRCVRSPRSPSSDSRAAQASKKPEVFPRAEEGVYDEDIQQSRTRVPEDVWCVPPRRARAERARRAVPAQALRRRVGARTEEHRHAMTGGSSMYRALLIMSRFWASRRDARERGDLGSGFLLVPADMLATPRGEQEAEERRRAAADVPGARAGPGRAPSLLDESKIQPPMEEDERDRSGEEHDDRLQRREPADAGEVAQECAEEQQVEPTKCVGNDFFSFSRSKALENRHGRRTLR